MYRGDYLTITPTGIQVREKSVEHVGLYDKSQCWGLWLQNPVEDPERLKRMRHKKDHCNLIISPFHPRSWPFLLRIQVWLVDSPGALAMLAKELRSLGLSILSSECASSGFGQATWNVVAEVMGVPKNSSGLSQESVQKLKREKTLEDARASRLRVQKRVLPHLPLTQKMENSRKDERKKSREMLRKVEELMRAYQSVVQKHLKELLEEKRTPFLRWRDVERSLFNKQARSLKLTRGMESFEVEWIWTLAVFSAFGGGSDAPMPFHYDADRSVLRCGKGEQLDDVLGHRTQGLPAIGSFCWDHQFLRIDPLIEGVLRHELLQLDITYSLASENADGMHHAPGMIQRIAEELSSRDIDILLINNKWTDYRYRTEAGGLRMLVDARSSQKEDLEESIRVAAERDPSCSRETSEVNGVSGGAPGTAVVGSSEGSDDQRPSIKSVIVRPAANRRLFVSYHAGHPREASLLRQIRRAAETMGFEVKLVETFTKGVTDSVVQQIRYSDAMLQVLFPRPDESASNLRIPWLDYEFGVAAGVSCPWLRMIDVSRIQRAEWEGVIRTHRDHALKEFRLDVSDEDLYAAVRQAIELLAGELVNRRS
jgi:hypothetical protein